MFYRPPNGQQEIETQIDLEIADRCVNRLFKFPKFQLELPYQKRLREGGIFEACAGEPVDIFWRLINEKLSITGLCLGDVTKQA